MSGSRFVSPYFWWPFPTGEPIPAALLNFYISPGDTRTPTYADAALTTPNTNPVVADGTGVFPSIFLDPQTTYRVVLTYPSDGINPPVEIWTGDPVSNTTYLAGAIQFDTIAAFEAATIVGSVNGVTVLGYYAAGDGGAAVYKRATAGAGIGKVQSADGQWWIITGGAYNVLQFGAKRDDATLNLVFIQNALDFVGALPTGGQLFVPQGQYLVESPGLTMTYDGVWLTGDGKDNTQLIYTGMTGTLLHVGNQAMQIGFCTVEKMTLSAQSAMSSGEMILLDNGQKILLQHLHLSNNLFWGIVLNSGTADGGQFTYKLDDIEIDSGSQGVLIGVVDTVQDVWMSRLTIAMQTFIGVNFIDCSGFYFTDSDILECNIGVQLGNQNGTKVEAGFVRAVTCDSGASHGWVIGGNALAPFNGLVTDILLEQCWASNNGVGSTSSHGFFIFGGLQAGNLTSGISLVNCISHGNGGDGVLLLAGLSLAQLSQVHVTAPQISGNGKHGFEVSGAVTNFSMTGGFSGKGGVLNAGNTQNGVQINAAASDQYVIQGVNLIGNVGGSISDSGTGTNKVVGPNITSPRTVGVFTVAALPAVGTVPVGSQLTVSDANQTLTAGIGAVVAGGGANVVPVTSDGAAWRIG